jgi:membrane-associated protein
MIEAITSLPLSELISAAGYVGIAAMVFCESGLPFGFIFPGDSLLFASGLFAAQGYFNIGLLIAIIVISAIAGDSVGYWIGKKIGPHIFTKDDSFWFNKKHLARTEAFYTKYGMSAVILARFVPVVRAFVPIFAGVGCMPYKKFLAYNIFGAFIWGAGIPLLGYAVGNVVPNAEQYILPLVLVVIVVSFIPIAIQLVKSIGRGSQRAPRV